MHITAAVTRSAEQRFCVEEIEIDAPRGDEVRVKITGVGLCHSDLLAAEQVLPVAFPIVLGHEGAGIVESVGPEVTNLKPGDRVVMTFNFCGKCVHCRNGEPAYCTHFLPLNYTPTRQDGTATLCSCGVDINGSFFGQSSFASYALGNARNVVKVPEGAPLEFLGPLGCGIQTGAGAVMRSLAAEAGSSVVIFGGGSVGLSAVMGAVVQGCETIILIEPMAGRRELGLSLGATHAFDPRGADVPALVREVLPAGVNYAVDTSGAVPAIQAALLCLGARGVLGLIGVPSDANAAFSVSILGALSNAITIKSVIEGDSNPETYIPELVALYKAGRFPIDRLIKTYPFAEINQAVEDQKNGLCVKAVLVF